MGAAVHSPTLFFKSTYRLPNNLSIYYAEAFAILKALNLAISHNLDVSTTIISDCSHVLQDIKYLNLLSSPHPSIISEISHLLNSSHKSNISLKWMSSHTNSPFFKTIDLYAKEATCRPDIYPIPFTCTEAILLIESWICNKWYKYWADNKTCNYQSIFNLPCSYFNHHNSRKKEVIISRIRLQQTQLNSGLFKIKLHPTGLCQTCLVPQTGFHLIWECLNTVELENQLSKKLNKSKPFNFNLILNIPDIMDIMAEYTIKHNINI